jgi:HK97 family phage portal protein
MASIIDQVKAGIIKALSTSGTDPQYNKLLYTWLGTSVIMQDDNDETYIREGYQRNATIYSIINLITKAATTVPFQIYQVKSDSKMKQYKSMTSGHLDGSAIYRANLLRKSAMELVTDSELEQVLKRPNPEQSFSTWLQEVIAFGKLTGNRYIYGISPETGPNQGKFKQLYVMPSQLVEIVSGGLMDPVQAYKIIYNSEYFIAPENMCHIKDFNPDYNSAGSNLYGQSPLRAGLRVMMSNNEAVTTGLKYLQNQTSRGMLVSKDGTINETQAQALKDKFRKTYQGAGNAGDIIITPKDLSWVNFGLTASDLSLIEQYNGTVKDLCNIYNIPVQLLNNTDASTYNNQKEAKKALYQNAVIPELIKIRDELNRWLVPQYGADLYFDFDFTAISELQEEVDKLVTQMAAAWWITPNEKREAMNYGKDDQNPFMDDYYIPSNLMPQNVTIDALEAPKALDIDYSFKAASNEMYDDYPKKASDNAQKMLDWKEKYPDEIRGGTEVGWTRARQLADRDAISRDIVSRMAQFNRHRENAKVADEYKDTPWKDAGYVAWNLWGGTQGVDWAIAKMKEINAVT